MNKTQARIIMKCKVPISITDIWRRFEGDFSYDHLRRTCQLLELKGYLIKRSSKGLRVGGRPAHRVFYTAEPKAIGEAQDVLTDADEEVVPNA